MMKDGTHWEDEWGQAWDDFRNEGFADVQAALQWCREQAEAHAERKEEVDELTHPQAAKHHARKSRVLSRRATGLSMLLEYMAVQGPSGVPEWEKAFLDEEKSPTLPLSPRYERRLRAALRALSDEKGIVRISRDASEDETVDVGQSTVLKELRETMEQKYGVSINRDAETFRRLLRREAENHRLHDELSEPQLEKLESDDSS